MSSNIRKRIGVAVCASALLALPLSSSALAASAAWSPETLLTPPSGGAAGVHTAVNAAGTSALAWDQQIGPGTNQVEVAVHSAGGWSPTVALGSPASNAATGSVVVEPNGQVDVLFSSNGSLQLAHSADAGRSWSAPEALPADAGYIHLVGAGVDRLGNLEAVVAAQRTTTPPGSYDAEALVRPTGGTWSAPVKITSTPVPAPLSFSVNGNGQALFAGGFVTYRSPTPGAWGSPQTVTPVAGQIFSTSAAMDAGGRGYFVFRSRYGGAYVAHSDPTGVWSAPVHVAKFDALGSSVMVTGSSDGNALIYGVDYTTNKARAAITTNGGSSWGALLTLGGGQYSTDSMVAVGSEAGLYAVSWNNDGDSFWVATGSGAGSGTAAWVKNKLAPNLARGAAAINGGQAVAGWARGTDPVLTSTVVGAATTTVAP